MKTDLFEPSRATLTLPVPAAEELVISGLSAPQWRLALVLMCLSWEKSEVTLEKPLLEQLAGVTLNTVDKLLAPLLEAAIEIPGHPLDGEPVFENIEYYGGRRGKRVGQVRATLSIAMSQYLAGRSTRLVSLPADEMRRYSHVSSIILRLRLAAAFETTKTAKSARMRVQAAEVSGLFGSYGRVAMIRRPSTVTGEIKEHVSLSRAGAMLVEPAIDEINRHSDFMRLRSTVLTEGRTWAAIDIEVSKLQKRKPKTFGEIKRKAPGHAIKAVLRNP